MSTKKGNYSVMEARLSTCALCWGQFLYMAGMSAYCSPQCREIAGTPEPQRRALIILTRAIRADLDAEAEAESDGDI